MGKLPQSQAQPMPPLPSQIARRLQVLVDKMDVWHPNSPPLPRSPWLVPLASIPIVLEILSMMHRSIILPLVLAVSQAHIKRHGALSHLRGHLWVLEPPLPRDLPAQDMVGSAAVVINGLPVLTICFNNLGAVVIAQETPHLFVEEMPHANQTQWRGRQLSLQTGLRQAPQDLKKINPATVQTVAVPLT